MYSCISTCSILQLNAACNIQNITYIQWYYAETNMLFGRNFHHCLHQNFVRRTAFLLQCIALRWRHNGRDGVSNHQPHDCLLSNLFGRRSKKTSKFRVTGLCAGNSLRTGEFPAQMASNAENVSIWWRHHGYQHTVHAIDIHMVRVWLCFVVFRYRSILHVSSRGGGTKTPFVNFTASKIFHLA